MIESKNKKKQSVVIIGASGHGKVVADIVACMLFCHQMHIGTGIEKNRH